VLPNDRRHIGAGVEPRVDLRPSVHPGVEPAFPRRASPRRRAAEHLYAIACVRPSANGTPADIGLLRIEAADLSRTDGPTDAIAHGYLVDAPIALFASEVAGDQLAVHADGLMLSLLGTADAATLRGWFARLADGGTVADDLQQRPWGAFDGRVIDRYGVHWLIGFETDAAV
jgi:PhnB protein